MGGCRARANYPAGFDFGRRHFAQQPNQLLILCFFEKGRTIMSGILWIVIVGFVAGIIARLLSPGPNNPSGFILTTVLGIAGAFIATFIGQAIGHYGPDQGAGFITATIGALLVLFIWNRLVANRVISDPGNR
jgi:uncharacterized membrane protein YeaQ/YmgE (transglycosylase-associated protein family)